MALKNNNPNSLQEVKACIVDVLPAPRGGWLYVANVENSFVVVYVWDASSPISSYELEQAMQAITEYGGRIGYLISSYGLTHGALQHAQNHGILIGWEW